MKRIAVVLCFVLLLTGCSGTEDHMDRAMAFRAKLLAAAGCSFDAVITADYGDVTYTFTMKCSTDQQGNLRFSVAEPQTISGISGIVSATGGKKTLRSGYLSSCGREGGNLRLSIDDSYEEDAMHLDIWLGEGDLPARGEILWQGRRVLSIEVENFTFL